MTGGSTLQKREVTKLSGNKGVGRGKAQKFAVEKYGVEDYVLEKFKSNVPIKQISSLLEEEKDVKIAPYGISRWIKRVTNEQSTSVRSKQKFEVMVINYQTEITTILNEVKSMKDRAINDNDLKAYDKLVGRLFQGLELLAKLMGDMKGEKKQVDINILINEISQRSFEENKGMRHQFYNTEVIDVEAEIIEEENKRTKKMFNEE